VVGEGRSREAPPYPDHWQTNGRAEEARLGQFVTPEQTFMSESTLPIGRREFFGSSSSLLKNLEIGALAVFLPRVLGRSGCCEQTLTYAVSSLGMRVRL
jgi:hypothetical protein